MKESKMENSKMDESLNLKSENRNRKMDRGSLAQSNVRFRISDLRCRIRSISNFSFSTFSFFICTLLLGVTLTAAQGKRTFVGTITDNMCATADHSRMRMGSTDAECTIACISAHGATYVLYDGKDVYGLSDQQTPEKFAGKKVTVTGTLDAKTRTIQVDSIRISTSDSKSP
jgi:hypothetical protein